MVTLDGGGCTWYDLYVMRDVRARMKAIAMAIAMAVYFAAIATLMAEWVIVHRNLAAAS